MSSFKNLISTRPGANSSTVVVRPAPMSDFLGVSSVQNLGQQLEFQLYNADGDVVTRYRAVPQLMVEKGIPKSFTPQNVNNLSADLKGSEARLLESLKYTADETSKILQDAVKIDYLLCIRSQESLPVEFNMLQTPVIQTKLTYKFYTPDEEELATQEDQALDPLLKNEAPARFVQLTWEPVNTVNSSQDFAARTAAEQATVTSYLDTVRGTTTLTNQQTANSFANNLRQVSPIFRAGQALKLVDTHDLQRGFSSTSNSRLFKNTAITTVNANNVDLDTVSFNELILEDL